MPLQILIVSPGEELEDDPLLSMDSRRRCSRRSFFSRRHGNRQGVWRIKALEDSGIWMERTTVEDMEIAVRAHIKGWKFLYGILNDVECQCELLESSIQKTTT